MGPRAGHIVAAAAFALAFVAAPALAQETAEPAYASAPAETPLTPEEAAVLGNALVFDPAQLTENQPARPLQLPDLNAPYKFGISRTDKADGVSTVTAKQPLAQDVDVKLGADLNLGQQPFDGYRPGKPLPVTSADRDSGAAWASVGLTTLASLDARVDPASDQGKLGTTLKQSIPLGSKFSVTLQNSYSVTETFSPTGTAPADLPLMSAPAVTAPPQPQVWDSRNAVKFDILTTGTTLGAGITTASNDRLTHNTFSADQKLYGPLHVTTAVTDVGQPTSNKSISAGLKLNW